MQININLSLLERGELIIMEEETIKQEENKTEEKSLIEKTEELVKRLEEANKRTEELAKKNEELLSRQILGGRTEAGKQNKEPTEEDKIKEEANKIIKSIGFKPIE